jgi:hypothetical protein
MIHIVPLNDLKPHTEEGTQCPCEPHVFFNDPATGEALVEPIVLHKAWDNREVVEEAEALLKGETWKGIGRHGNGES